MGRMTDTALAKRAREYKHHRAEADKCSADILAELERRKVGVGSFIEIKGVKIRHKQWRRRRYSIAALKATLRPKHRQRVIVETVDLAALDELIRTNEITDVDAKECFEGYDEGATYPDVHIIDPNG